jgi:menaquinone-9 beta-reductase
MPDNQSITLDTEVLVVGGGPAGSATATFLARLGHDVLLLDRARFPRPKACAEYLSPATVGVIARLGALTAVEMHRPVRPLGMALIQGERARALVRYPDHPVSSDPARPEVGVSGAGAEQRALCLPRDLLDHTLLEHARRHGVRVLEGWQVIDVRIDASGATVVAREQHAPAQVTRDFRARLVVGADGLRSTVARAMGVSRRTIWPRRVGFVAHFQGGQAAHFQDYGEMHIGDGVYCGLAPLPGGLINVGLVMSVDSARRAGSATAALDRGLGAVAGARARLTGASRVTPIRGVSPLGARVSRCFGDGYILVGDAAGFLDPFTGEGVFRALRGAELAAQVVHEALTSHSVSARALAPYSWLRRQEFGAKTVLCWAIQGMLAWPPLLTYALERLSRRPAHCERLSAVLGDYRPAAETLRPQFLWGLLRP